MYYDATMNVKHGKSVRINVLRRYIVARNFTVILTLNFNLLHTVNNVWISLLLLVLSVRGSCILH